MGVKKNLFAMNGIQKTLLALVAMLVTVGYLWQSNRADIPRQASMDDVRVEARQGGYRLISTDELADRHGEDASRLLIIDTRQAWEYRTGHIQGALNFPMEPTWWARWREAGALERFLGPEKDRTLVFY